MGRAKRTRLWIALPGGIAINGLLLVSLILFERAPPTMEGPPIVVLTFERSEPRRRMVSRQMLSAPGKPTASTTTSPTRPSTQAKDEPSPATSSGLAVEPAWVIGDGAYLRPETAGPARRLWNAGDQRRYQRACIGLSNEHMTPEEKDRCWDAWGGAKPVDDKRIGPREAVQRGFGPLALKDPGEKGPFAKQARRQERCRDYRKRTMPGMKGVEAPPLREGGCF